MATEFKVRMVPDTWDCGCCGTVHDKEYFVDFNGEKKSFSYDSHFGNGQMEYDGLNNLKNILTFLNEFKSVFADLGYILNNAKINKSNIEFTCNDKELSIGKCSKDNYQKQFYDFLKSLDIDFIYIEEDEYLWD